MSENEKPKQGRYDWGEWFSLYWIGNKSQPKVLTLKRGVDYECMTHSMAVLIRLRAPTYGVHVSIKTLECDVLKVTVTQIEERSNGN